jgi:hypothetical protein
MISILSLSLDALCVWFRREVVKREMGKKEVVKREKGEK